MIGLLLALSLGQVPVTIIAPEDTTDKRVWVGDFANKALRVNCVTGCSSGASGGLTDTQLRATPVPVSGTFWQTTQPVSGSVSVSNLPASQAVTGTFWQTTQPVSGTVTATGPLTDTQLRATAVPVSLSSTTVTGSVAVTGPLTDTQLRASAVPVSLASTTVTGSVAVTGPLTDTQLRASAVPVSLTSTTITGTAAVTQSGTWTVQPGNTANTTAWLTTAATNAAVAGTAPTSGVLTGARATADAASPTARTAGQLADNVADLEGRLLVHTDHPRRVMCRLTTTATTSTAVTGCAAPGAGLSLYITDISIYGGVAVGATAAASIQYGTGGTCGTGTTVIYDCQHGATGGCEAHLVTPRKAAANSEVCILDATVGTKFINLSGYIAP